MKTNIIFLILLITFLFSCNSDKTMSAENSNSMLIGKWEWTKSVGGIGAITYTPLSTNKNKLLEITSDKIKFFENGTLTFEKKYNIETQQSIFGGQKEMLIFEQNSMVKQSFEISAVKLFLNDECADCFSSQYIKL